MTPRPRPRSVNKGVAGNIAEEVEDQHDDKVGHPIMMFTTYTQHTSK